MKEFPQRSTKQFTTTMAELELARPVLNYYEFEIDDPNIDEEDVLNMMKINEGLPQLDISDSITALGVFINMALFVIAGICEIGGGYLVWQFARGKKPFWWGILGSVVLVIYGFIPPLQSDIWTFSTIYATYGGMFVVMSLLFGWSVDGDRPDKWDWIACVIVLVGCAVMMFVPRDKN